MWVRNDSDGPTAPPIFQGINFLPAVRSGAVLPSLCKKIIFTWPLNLSVTAAGHVNLRNSVLSHTEYHGGIKAP